MAANVVKYLVDGFASGISAQTWKAEARATAMANSAYYAAMKALDSHSPSRVFMKVGNYVAQGFAIGIDEKTGESTEAAASMADSAINTVRSTIARIGDMFSANIDTEPTIRPVLDLSDVKAGASRLQELFNGNEVSYSSRQAMSVSADMKKTERSDNTADAKVPTTSNTYQFTQNNYSPKALTRDEIYRQTKNQFSAMERMVEA